ncbi:MAG: hypothetical protein ACT4PO_14385 [Actinomycetota bacterium]
MSEIAFQGAHYRLSPEQIAWRRATIRDNFSGDERAFRQEYPATAREAFLVSGNAFFDEQALRAYEERTAAAIARGNFFSRAGIGFERAERGYVRIFEAPDPGGHYVIGADTAEGRLAAARDTSLSDPEGERGGRDFCSADVLKVAERVSNAETGKEELRPCRRQVAHIHGRMAPEVFAAQVRAAGYWYSCAGQPRQRTTRRPALVGVERNHSSGQTVLRLLRDGAYPEIFIARQTNLVLNKTTAELGWVTSGLTRMPMLDELAASIRAGEIAIPSAETVRECFTFVLADDGKPQAQEGAHDDRVISLAIALQMARYHRDPPRGELPKVEIPGSPTGL